MTESSVKPSAVDVTAADVTAVDVTGTDVTGTDVLDNAMPDAEEATAANVVAFSAAGHPSGQFAGGAMLAPGYLSDRLDLLRNVEMEVTAELGRTRMTVRELLSLAPGGLVELDRAAGSPIDLFVNGTLIARGEVVVIDEEFGIRISEIVGPSATETT